ncbi:hypothetical protein [Bradyrhizobium sp. Ash2021]|nr:hypothetical protein [Bradyrhizobium sp. Ash2021]WMT73337.1 hypothetical protein NL528_36075 [Bradyrhizobium sp. Ash2021]
MKEKEKEDQHRDHGKGPPDDKGHGDHGRPVPHHGSAAICFVMPTKAR